jgi:beta-glucanase (GH16 family)
MQRVDPPFPEKRMKTTLCAAFLIGSLSWGLMNATMCRAAPGDEKGDWKLVWADEFDKDGAPNPANWGFEKGFERNEEDQWYQPENARVENGVLIIEARHARQPNPNYEAGSTDWRKKRLFADYTSASLTTRGKQSWTYGRFEMRGKIDISTGMWPAFWTLGLKDEWPANGEIDIMEFYRGGVLANIAWGTEKRWTAKWNSKKRPITAFNDPDWANKFHTWRMDWDDKFIRLYLDDALMNEQDLSKTVNADGRNPFLNAPQYIILNLALGGQQGGDPSKANYPARFEVDYVRVYQKTNAK